MTGDRLMCSFRCSQREDTIQLGKRFGEKLKPGAVISLEGTLGAGKTVFVKGIAQALCISEEVTSPTYTIVSSYSGKYTLFHIDLYRIDRIDQLDELGMEDMLYGNGITVIEWGEKMESLLPKETIRVHIAVSGEDEREIRFSGFDLDV